MASYAAVETALARMHGADAEAQKGAFRGRIKHLQRLGLPLGEKPGKGKRIDYTDQQIWQFALALELSEFGLDPVTIVEIIMVHWDFLFGPWLEGQSESTDPHGSVLAISPYFMASNWKPLGETMGGIQSIGWRPRAGQLDTVLGNGQRRSIVIDTWAMINQLNYHLNREE